MSSTTNKARQAAIEAGRGAEPQAASRNATATEAQRDRLLRALRRRPHTTEELRAAGIFQVPARVKELRDRFGYSITTSRITLVDREGFSHPRAALYTLDEQEGRRDA